MHENVALGDIEEGAAWVTRAKHWRARTHAKTGVAGKKQGLRQPLILSGHGMRLRINHGALEVQNGFTHYPEPRESMRFFPGDRLMPSRVILLDGSGAITLDVLAWLGEQNIPLIQLDYRGDMVAMIGGNGIGHDPGLLQRQVIAADNPRHSMALATWIVREKLRQSAVTLGSAVPNSAAREVALSHIEGDIARLSQPWIGSIAALLGVEGKCAQVYFDAWRDIPIAWKGIIRKPIPETWHRIGPRGSRKDRSNKFARHPVQAMLNCADAVLQSQVRIEIARIGLDPATGFLHQKQSDRPALILDLIEPLRPRVDAVALGFLRAQTFAPGDFTLGRDGTCRLHPQLARRLVAEIGTLTGIAPLIADLLTHLGHTPPTALPHRSKAWLAQRSLTHAKPAI